MKTTNRPSSLSFHNGMMILGLMLMLWMSDSKVFALQERVETLERQVQVVAAAKAEAPAKATMPVKPAEARK